MGSELHTRNGYILPLEYFLWEERNIQCTFDWIQVPHIYRSECSNNGVYLLSRVIWILRLKFSDGYLAKIYFLKCCRTAGYFFNLNHRLLFLFRRHSTHIFELYAMEFSVIQLHKEMHGFCIEKYIWSFQNPRNNVVTLQTKLNLTNFILFPALRIARILSIVQIPNFMFCFSVKIW